MNKARLHITVSGIVQGVFFRATTCDKKTLEKFLEWCAKGPKGANVEQINYDWYNFTGEHRGFIIRH